MSDLCPSIISAMSRIHSSVLVCIDVMCYVKNAMLC